MIITHETRDPVFEVGDIVPVRGEGNVYCRIDGYFIEGRWTATENGYKFHEMYYGRFYNVTYTDKEGVRDDTRGESVLPMSILDVEELEIMLAIFGTHEEMEDDITEARTTPDGGGE